MTADAVPEVLHLECNLTIAYRRECWCSTYLIERRSVLLPEVAKEAARRDEDVVDVFADFARRLHAERCKTPTTGRIAALFAEIGGDR